MEQGKRPPFGAVLALVTAAVTAIAARRDPTGLGQDRLLRGSGKVIGIGGAIWLGWAALKRGQSRRA